MRELCELPIDEIRSEYLKERSRPCLIKASTGSGKSTRIPIWLLEEKIPFILVEPRRVVVRSLYKYLNPLCDEQLSYQVRFDSNFVPNPNALIVTPGIFLNYLQSGFPFKPELILIDEVHERGREIDFALAVLKERKFQSISLLSATMDDIDFNDYLDFKTFQLKQVKYKIDLVYSEHSLLPSSTDLEDQIRKNLQFYDYFSALIFLPGKSELYRVKKCLSDWRHPVFCMHGGISPDEQRKILDHPGPKVILSTNILESAVTVNGVDLVIDSGLKRVLQYREGREVLSTECVCMASATQRMGRTGRTGPGRCVRLWSSRASLEKQSRPEILRSKLTDLALRANELHLDPKLLPFLDSPMEYQWDHANQEIDRYFSDKNKVTGGTELILGTEFLSMFKQLKMRNVPVSFLDHLLYLRSFHELVGDFTKILQNDFEKLEINLPLDLWARRNHRTQEIVNFWCNLRSTFGIENTPELSITERHEFLSILMQSFPEHSFWIHPKKRSTLKNDLGFECLMDSRLEHKELKACFVFSFFEFEGHRKNRVTQAELLIPILSRESVRFPITRREYSEPRLKENKLLRVTKNLFGSHLISEEEISLQGADLRKALYQNNLLESFLPGFEEYYFYYQLYQQEKGLDDSFMIDEVLKKLGFESIDDFEFIGLDDLFSSDFIRDLNNLRERYPRSLKEPGGSYSISYDLNRKEVYFEQRKKGKEPSKLLLSRFRNWKCYLKSSGRCVRL